MEEGQQISHGLGLGLEAGHGRGISANHLLDQLSIVLVSPHTMEIRTHQTLSSQTMAASAIETKQSSAGLRGTGELKSGLGVGVGLDGWQRQHSQHKEYHQRKGSHHGADSLAGGRGGIGGGDGHGWFRRLTMGASPMG